MTQVGLDKVTKTVLVDMGGQHQSNGQCSPFM